MDVALNFINQSNDTDATEVVVFAKSVSSGPYAVACLVIQHCAPGDNHPFTYPVKSAIAYADSWGNYTPQLAAMPGEQFAAVRTISGDELHRAGKADAPNEIVLNNALPQGAIDVLIYKDGQLYASLPGVAPGEKAVFEFTPTIWIGTVTQVEQGDVMDEAAVSSANTEISLLGIASADIVMTGGGVGPHAQPYAFTLQNVVMA